MSTDENNPSKEKFVIGELIREVFLKSGLSVQQFANILACESRNVHRIFKRKQIDTDLLKQVSRALNFDFFHIYSDYLRLGKPSMVRMCIEIDIPAEEWDSENICKYCTINKKKLNKTDKK